MFFDQVIYTYLALKNRTHKFEKKNQLIVKNLVFLLLCTSICALPFFCAKKVENHRHD